jgi:hypothetical protein
MSDSATETAGGGFAELFAQSLKTMKEGEVVRGTVLSIDEENIQIDIGFKSEGLRGRGRPHRAFEGEGRPAQDLG